MFVGGELGVTWCELAAEECNQPSTLVHHSADAGAEGITFHNKVLGEV
jgi:hypothetical protein